MVLSYNIDIFLRLDLLPGGHVCLIILWCMVTVVVIPFLPAKSCSSLKITFDLALHSLQLGDVLSVVCV